MQTMERLGNCISRGVCTVSGPFHPFGGAVDIVVVEQQDGSFKSSPWYVRFGKFQGVLRAKENVVNISVNGAEADFHMYLDHKGEAFFLREVDAEDGESVMYTSSSSDETDNRPQDNKRPLRSKGFDFDSGMSNSVAQIDVSNSKILARTNSRRSRILGFVFGRRSMKGNNSVEGGVEDHGMNRRDSLERAEIAANLLEVKWSTNLADDKPPRKNNIKTWRSSPRQDNMENGLDQRKLNEEACSYSKQEDISCSSKSELEGIGEDEGLNLSCLSTQDKGNTNVKEVVYDSTRTDLQVACVELETHIEKQLNREEVSGVTTVDLPVYGISEEEFLANGGQSLVYCKTSETSMVGMDCSSEQTHELLYLASGGCQQVHVHAEILHATTVLLPEVPSTKDDTKNIDLRVPVEVSEFHSQETDCSHFGVSNYDMVDAKDPSTLPYPQTVNLDPGLCSLEQVQTNCVAASSCYSSLDNQVLDENSMKENDVSSVFSSPLVPVGDCVLIKASSRPSPAISNEEVIHSSDIDECRVIDQCEGSISPDFVVREDHFSFVDSIEQVSQLVDTNYNPRSSPESFITKSQMDDLQKFRRTSRPISIPRNKVAREEDGLLSRSLPNMSSHSDILSKHDVCYPLSQSLDSNSKLLKYTFPGKDYSKCLNSDVDKENQLLHEEPGDKDNHSSREFKSTVLNTPIAAPTDLGMIFLGTHQVLETTGMITVDQIEKIHTGDLSGFNPPPGGNWRLWPFSFRRSRSGKAMLPAPSDAKNATSGSASESAMSTDADKNELKPTPTRKKVRAKTPTSEQLASLNLKEGRNIVTFTFSTAMLGEQQVDAQIYLWKWNTRIVISDVDGTITRSDVLGQFMPLVGVDWSQTGVAHLFSAIKENGYQLVFLSARSISQAYHTRRFLFNLKQNGKVLPDGPVLISPDGLFPSLYREVIRRAPHEFKIACLEDIRALFPSDCNPFYAGFGNRDTDEISYLKVGIPKGKIFIINPKGEVAVNRCVDTKSYASLHALVHGMFPYMNSSEQEAYNSWNFWKLPPIDT